MDPTSDCLVDHDIFIIGILANIGLFHKGMAVPANDKVNILCRFCKSRVGYITQVRETDDHITFMLCAQLSCEPVGRLHRIEIFHPRPIRRRDQTLRPYVDAYDTNLYTVSFKDKPGLNQSRKCSFTEVVVAG